MVYQRQVPFERVAGLAATRTYDLNSSFRPSYNMAVNLVRNYDREQAHQLLNSSFAQFLADRGVVQLERQRERDLESLAGYRTNLACDLGDFDEYWGLFAKPSGSGRKTTAAGSGNAWRRSGRSSPGCGPGEVIHVPRTRRRGLAVVLSSRDGKPTVLSEDRSYFRLSAKNFDDPPTVLTRIAPAVGELSEREVPPRRGLEAGVAARQASARGAAPRRPRGR